jgi:hypothetical protein
VKQIEKIETAIEPLFQERFVTPCQRRRRSAGAFPPCVPSVEPIA